MTGPTNAEENGIVHLFVRPITDDDVTAALRIVVERLESDADPFAWEHSVRLSTMVVRLLDERRQVRSFGLGDEVVERTARALWPIDTMDDDGKLACLTEAQRVLRTGFGVD